MTLPVDEFMRRFLLHVLPDGFHRIRHYGFVSPRARVKNVARIRQMIADVSGAPQARQNVGEPHAEPAEAGVDDERENPSLPLLWWSHDHRRALRPRRRPANVVRSRMERYIMICPRTVCPNHDS